MLNDNVYWCPPLRHAADTRCMHMRWPWGNCRSD